MEPKLRFLQVGFKQSGTRKQLMQRRATPLRGLQ
jgi:hypothetical protein